MQVALVRHDDVAVRRVDVGRLDLRGGPPDAFDDAPARPDQLDHVPPAREDAGRDEKVPALEEPAAAPRGQRLREVAPVLAVEVLGVEGVVGLVEELASRRRIAQPGFGDDVGAARHRQHQFLRADEAGHHQVRAVGRGRGYRAA